jgi:Rad3-related DNA helicase
VVTPSPAIRLKLAVRTLAQLTCRRGDIHFRFDEATGSQEGIALQKKLQRGRAATYQREGSVAGVWKTALHGVEVELLLAGRADGWDRELGVVEEFKTTRIDPARLYAHVGSVHIGQLRLYAALFARDAPEQLQWQLRLLYCHPDTGVVTPHEETISTHDLAQFLDRCCEHLARQLIALHAHREQRNAALADLAFPFPDFRPAQRGLAADVYRTVRDGGALLVEAPTGSGKTLGTLFPALRAMGDGKTDRIVFLSSRTTGQAAAEASTELLQTSNVVRQITVTAKAKICFMPEPVCDPELCPYARDYYERNEAAVLALLAVRTMSRAAIEAVARAHRVCPFELSLDAAVWADLVICDYNYVFDPVVRLKRLAGIAGDRMVLLVDEAHQLGDRVRDGLSTVFSRSLLQGAKKASGSGPLARRAAALDRQMTALRRELVHKHYVDRSSFEWTIEWPAALLRAAETLFEAMAEHHGTRQTDPVITEVAFALARLLRVANWYDAEHFAVFLRGRRSEIELDVRCLDPSAAIAETLQEFRAHVRFSATVSPFPLFARLHGQPDARMLRLPSPFPPEHLAVFVVPDVNTMYRARRRSLPDLIAVLHTLVAARHGNYLVALPSFEYLDLVADAFIVPPGYTCVRQTRNMSDAERAAFLATFHDRLQPVVGFAVLGGVFAESIDLPGDALIGMAVVGIGLPPPSLERTAMEEHFGEPDGRMIAYEQPALTRVVQAVGRLIRTGTDRGAVCLIDSRYQSQHYRHYLPAHWSPVRTPARELASSLDAFWNTG